MAFLRLGSTRRVVGLLVGAAAALVLLAVVAGSALGVGGQPPPAKPLANAIHDSLTGPKIAGVTARVTFTSHLFDGATTETSSALMKGGSGRLWAAPGKLRVELQSDNGDAQIVVADGKGFVYDGPSDTAYTFAMAPHKQDGTDAAADTPPTIAQIQDRITKADKHAVIGDPQPEVVAGQPAYEVRVTPRESGGLVGAAALAWDAASGAPLKVAIYARGAATPVIDLSVTDINYGAVDPSVFDVSPPAGAKVVDLGGGRPGSDAGGWHAYQKPTFAAVAPAALGSRDRRELKQAGDGWTAVYGKGLDSIIVAEHVAKKGDQPQSGGGMNSGQPLDLPTTSINGARATAIGTPLGGVLSFQRGGIAYAVAGSQPLSVLEDAARGL